MHIDFLVKDRKYYSHENYMAAHLSEAFKTMGVTAEIVSLANEGFRDYFFSVQANPPDLTIAFEPLFMLDKPLCDTLCIPHLHWELHSLGKCIHLTRSCYGNVIFKEPIPVLGLNFLPHPVAIKGDFSKNERPFDSILFADLVDLSSKIAIWENLFSQREFLMIQKGMDLAQENKSLSVYEMAFQLHSEDPESINISDLIFCMEEYESIMRTRALIESFEGSRLDVFGEHVGNNWIKRLKNNIFLHSSLPYTEHFEVLKMAKILLGTQDEWRLAAWEAGCFVLTNPNSYLKELQDMITYFLNEAQKRMDLIEQYRNVCQDHTFVKRAETLFNLMVQNESQCNYSY